MVDVLPVRLPPCTKPTCHHRRSCRLSLSSPRAGAARRHPHHTTTTAGAPSPPLLWPAVQLSSASVSISPRGEAPLLPCAALAGTAPRHAALTAWQPLCHCVAYAPQYSSPARGHHRTTAPPPPHPPSTAPRPSSEQRGTWRGGSYYTIYATAVPPSPLGARLPRVSVKSCSHPFRRGVCGLHPSARSRTFISASII